MKLHYLHPLIAESTLRHKVKQVDEALCSRGFHPRLGLFKIKMGICSVLIASIGEASPLADMPTGQNQKKAAIFESVTISSDEVGNSPRWMYGTGEVPRGSALVDLMAAAKNAQTIGDSETCLKKIALAWPKEKDLHPWLALIELDCAMRVESNEPVKLSQVKTTLPAQRVKKLAEIVAKIEKNTTWLITGAQVEPLRLALVKSYVFMLEHDVKFNKPRAKDLLIRTEELLRFSDENLRAKFWRLAAELEIQSQNPFGARELLRRSLQELETDEARVQLSQIETSAEYKNRTGRTVESGTSPQGTAKSANGKVMPPIESTKDELDLVERVTQSMKTGDLVSAVSDAVSLMQDFPGGTRAKWAADRAMEAYWSVADKTEPKLLLMRNQLIKRILGADADHLIEWSKSMFAKGQWEDSILLTNRALESVGGSRTTQMIEQVAKAALALDKYDLSKKFFSRLVNQHAGSPQAREALLSLGLIHFRLREFAQAVTEFERYLAQPNVDRFELTARYWLWRSLQRSGNDKADEAADEILKKFPFSYYGLRARLERGAGVLDWSLEKSKIVAKVWLTPAEKKSWKRVKIFISAGWFDEAQAELTKLPRPQSAEEKATRALTLAAAMSFGPAAKFANEAWDEIGDLRRQPLVAAAFPVEYSSWIELYSSQRKLDPYLVRGLIKQESSFNKRAVSSANAHGLMQMLPATAKEVSGELKLGALNVPEDLFAPERGIQMGTYYLAKVLNKFSGHVPLALAAYNAGPARIDRWLKNRNSLKNLAQTRSSNPDEEIWFDEIPYSETSIYIKSVLRNLLIYKMLDKGRVKVSEPIWMDSN